MTISLLAYQAILLLLFVLAAMLLYKANRGDNDWQFLDMLLTFKAGKPIADRQAFMLIGGWFVLTAWGTYKLVAVKEMDEWFVLLYAAYCAGSYGYSRLLKSKEGKEGKA